MAKYSIIIPTYNGAKFLAETIRSALDQDVEGVEVVVVDDGSRDQSLEIAESFKDVSVIAQENLGEAAARNSGLMKASGDFIVFLDHDDLLTNDALRKHEAAFMTSRDLKLVFGSNYRIDEYGKALPSVKQDRKFFSGLDVAQGTTPSFSQCMYKRKKLLEIGGFRETTSPSSDHDINIRLLGHQNLGYCHGEYVMKYRKHIYQTTGRPSVLMKKHLAVLDEHLGAKGIAHSPAVLRSAKRFWKTKYGIGLPGELYRAIKSRKISDASSVLSTILRTSPWSLFGLAKRIMGATKDTSWKP